MAFKHGSETVPVSTRRGLTDVTDRVRTVVRAAGVRRGVCTVFIRHTSASLVVQENADPAVLADLEAFLSRLVPEGDRLYTHRAFYLWEHRRGHRRRELLVHVIGE